MHDFCYVSKKEAAPVKAELLDIIHEVQDIVRDDFTFQFTFIGSSSRNMITYDRKSNIGFDFDINIEVNDDDENYEPKEIRTIIRKALDKVARQYGYDYCEDSTRVLTIKKKDRPNSRIIHSCDFAIVNNCGGGRQQSKESKPPNPLAVTGRCISPKAVPASYTNSKSNRPATSDTRKGFGWTPVSSLRTSTARISACMRQRESALKYRPNTG